MPCGSLIITSAYFIYGLFFCYGQERLSLADMDFIYCFSYVGNVLKNFRP